MEATGDLQAEDGSVGSVFDGRHVSHAATMHGVMAFRTDFQNRGLIASAVRMSIFFRHNAFLDPTC